MDASRQTLYPTLAVMESRKYIADFVALDSDERSRAATSTGQVYDTAFAARPHDMISHAVSVSYKSRPRRLFHGPSWGRPRRLRSLLAATVGIAATRFFCTWRLSAPFAGPIAFLGSDYAMQRWQSALIGHHRVLESSRRPVLSRFSYRSFGGSPKGSCRTPRTDSGKMDFGRSARGMLGRRLALPAVADIVVPGLGILSWIASLVVGVVGLLLGALYFNQRSLLYLPGPGEDLPSQEAAVVLLPADAGGKTKQYAAVYFRPVLDMAPVLVYFHGNADQLCYGPAFLGSFYRQRYGFGLYGVEYPGYGLAERAGPPSEASLYTAAETLLRHLVDDLGVDRSRIVLFGQSLGCAVALEMAKRGYGAKLVMLSPFTSVPEIAVDIYPFLRPALEAAPWLVMDGFDNAKKAPEVTLPTLVIHGTEDEIVPAWMGQKLAKLLPHARLMLPRGMGHNDALDRIDVLDAIASYARQQDAAS